MSDSSPPMDRKNRRSRRLQVRDMNSNGFPNSDPDFRSERRWLSHGELHSVAAGSRVARDSSLAVKAERKQEPVVAGTIVMVVEDSADLRMLYSAILTSEGYEVLEASHGQEALELIRSGRRPSLIILDLNMPVMDGREFLNIRASDPDMNRIPVIVCSAVQDKLPGDVAYLRKPLDLDYLLDQVRTYSA